MSVAPHRNSPQQRPDDGCGSGEPDPLRSRLEIGSTRAATHGIDTCRAEAFGDSVREVPAHTDAAFDHATAADRRAMRKACLKTVR